MPLKQMNTSVQTTANHLTSDHALREIHLSEGNQEVSDGCAATIASWFASPGQVGHVLAELSQGLEVDLESLLHDIHQTRLSTSGLSPEDRLSLDMLATWAIRKVNDR